MANIDGSTNWIQLYSFLANGTNGGGVNIEISTTRAPIRLLFVVGNNFSKKSPSNDATLDKLF